MSYKKVAEYKNGEIFLEQEFAKQLNNAVINDPKEAQKVITFMLNTIMKEKNDEPKS